MQKKTVHTKLLAATAAFLLVFAASLVSQDAGGESLRVAEESAIVLDDTAGEPLPDAANSDQGGTFWILFRIVLVLVLICAAMYGIVYLIKRGSGVSAANDPYLRVVAQLPLAPGKTAQVLTVGSQAFLVGVSDTGIQPIAELTDKELIDAMNLEADRNPHEPIPSFSALLSRFLPGRTGYRAEEASVPHRDDTPLSAGETAEFIRRQRERLGKTGREGNGGTGRSE